MKVKIGNRIYDAEIEPIMLIFDNDSQRKLVAGHLTNMPERDDVRLYATFPDQISEVDKEKFMELPPNIETVSPTY